MTPSQDDTALYTVCYEASFEPRALDQARVEVWGTTTGEVAVWFELRKRLAQRLRLRAARYKRFAAGHEPRELSESALLAVLDAVALGRVAVVAVTVPGLGIVSAHAVASREVRQALQASGNAWLHWLDTRPRHEPRGWRHLLEYRRWE